MGLLARLWSGLAGESAASATESAAPGALVASERPTGPVVPGHGSPVGGWSLFLEPAPLSETYRECIGRQLIHHPEVEAAYVMRVGVGKGELQLAVGLEFNHEMSPWDVVAVQRGVWEGLAEARLESAFPDVLPLTDPRLLVAVQKLGPPCYRRPPQGSMPTTGEQC